MTGLFAFLLDACSNGQDDGPASQSEHAAPPPAFTGIGEPIGVVVSGSIDAMGGVVTTAGGELVVSIPRGALAGAAEIGIQPITNEAPGGVGTGFRLTPDGQTFAEPVELVLSYNGADLGGTPPEALAVATQTAAGSWQLIGHAVVDTDAATVSVHTMHFSDVSLIKGFQIRPPSALIKTGESVSLTVRYCFDPALLPDQDESGDVLAPFGYECDSEVTDLELTPLLPLANVLAWRVNGIEGGNGSLGRVVANGGARATYIAPADVPSPNPVTVSAEMPWGAKGTLVSLAEIEIGTGGYAGTISFEDPAVPVRLNGNVRWTAVEPGAQTLDGSATLDLQMSPENCSLVTRTVVAGGELSLNFPEDGRYHFSLLTDNAALSCNGIEVRIGGFWLLCTGWPENPPPMGDGSSLTGSASCDGATMDWDFRRD